MVVFRSGAVLLLLPCATASPLSLQHGLAPPEVHTHVVADKGVDSTPPPAVGAAATLHSPARPLLFFHIGHTGGGSLIETLGLRIRDPEADVAPHTEECADVPLILMRHENHMSAEQARPYYTDAEWESAFKVAIVRNPWDKLVSFYGMRMNSLQKRTTFQRDASIVVLEQCGCANATTPNMVAQDEPYITPAADNTYACSFSHFLKQCAPTGLLTKLPAVAPDGTHFQAEFYENVFKWPETNYVMTTAAIAEKATTLTDHSVAIDMIIRTENLDEHVHQMLLAAGNAPELATRCAGSMLHISKSPPHAPYYEFYATAELQELGRQLFKDDELAFNYAFNRLSWARYGPAPLTVLKRRYEARQLEREGKEVKRARGWW